MLAEYGLRVAGGFFARLPLPAHRSTRRGATMARPKLHRNTTELDAEIARVQRETEAELRRLQDERHEAEGREDRRRGEVVRACLAGSHGDALRRILAASVSDKDRPLFGMASAPEVPASDLRAGQ
jgi:hypothetical protein